MCSIYVQPDYCGAASQTRHKLTKVKTLRVMHKLTPLGNLRNMLDMSTLLATQLPMKLHTRAVMQAGRDQAGAM